MSELNPTPEELWEPIAGYEGLYEISNRGRVRSLRRRLILRTDITSGYLRVRLCRSGATACLIHRLVAFAFIGAPPDESRTHVNHRDGNKTNNSASNLEWVSRIENAQHASRYGLLPTGRDHWTQRIPERLCKGDQHWTRAHSERVIRGERAANAKLTDDKVRDIRQRLRSGEAVRAIARRFGVTPPIIRLIRDGKLWTHVIA